MEIIRAGSRPSGKGPETWFTGTVRIDPLFNPFDAARVQGAQVTFEPGARTAWHTHPLGQTLAGGARGFRETCEPLMEGARSLGRLKLPPAAVYRR
jgi:hypothetical protein